MKSGRYTRDYNEVKALGACVNSARTPEQTDLAYFWADNFIAQWHRALRAIAGGHVTKIGDSARLFALVSLAMVDAVITAWESKKHYVFWRPVTAIQEGDNDGNPRTAGDLAWQPLLNTPNYPDYTSGANNVTGAATRALALFVGTDRFTFLVTSNNPLAVQKTRTYSAFRTRPRMWSTSAYTRASTSASRTQRRVGRARKWRSGPSSTSCGLSTMTKRMTKRMTRMMMTRMMMIMIMRNEPTRL